MTIVMVILVLLGAALARADESALTFYPAHWVDGDSIEPTSYISPFGVLAFSSPAEGWMAGERYVLHIRGERLEVAFVDLGHSKRADQIIVGFAAETDNVVDNARAKLARKNLDLIVANDVSAPNVGFAHETNEVTILPAHGEPQKVSLTSKREVADRILDAIVQQRSRQ